MKFPTDKSPGAWPDEPISTGFLSLDRLRRHCAQRECPERGRFWPRWPARTEEIEFEGRRYCSASCAETAFAPEIERHLLLARQEQERPHRVPLGLLLVSRGLITSVQLQQALQQQRERPGLRLGSLLLEAMALSEASLTATLGIQWGCPVFPLETNRAYLECGRPVPFALLRSAGVLPAHHCPATGVLHLAFTKRINHTLLYAVEKMCGVRAVPCVAADRLVAEALHRIEVPPSEETVFDSVRGPQDMAHLAAGYAGRLRAARVQVTRAADHVWFRFENHWGSHHLLFHSPTQRHSPAGPFR
jgi:hypothetical protein